MKLLQKFRSLDGAGDVDLKIEGEVNTHLHLLTVDRRGRWTSADVLEETREELPTLEPTCKELSYHIGVPVEAMFSTCGLMLNVKRSSMAPYRANILPVIHYNYPKFFPITRAGAAASAAADAKL